MKRSSVILAIGASVIGCLAFSSTASALPQYGPNICYAAYTHCLYFTDNTQAECEAQLQQCLYEGGRAPQSHIAAKANGQPIALHG